MGMSFTVGGAKSTFEATDAAEVAEALDQAFGAEGEWEGVPSRHFGGTEDINWDEFQERAVAELGADMLSNLLAMGPLGRGVYLPANVQAVSLPLACGDPLSCASLPGLRRELGLLAERWDLPWDDEGLRDLLRVGQDPDDGPVADLPEVLTFARLALAANEAVRRDCPLWVLG